MFRYADERINRLRVVARSWLARLPVASRLYVPIKLARGMRYLKRSHHDAVCPPFLTLFDEIRDRSMKGKKKKRNSSAFVEDILTISHPISYDPRDTTYDTIRYSLSEISHAQRGSSAADFWPGLSTRPGLDRRKNSNRGRFNDPARFPRQKGRRTALKNRGYPQDG